MKLDRIARLVVLLLTGLAATVFARAGSFPTTPYTLTADATYQEGCFDPCMCPIIMEQPMSGGFDLVFYPFGGPLWTVAVEQIDWSVPTLGKQITGQGLYRRAGDQQRMQLELQIDGEGPRSLDSGWVVGGDAYPAIDIVLTMNDYYCFDIVLRLRAEPAQDTPRLSVGENVLSWTAVPGSDSYDVVCGDLMQLQTSGGDFHSAIDACLADDIEATVLPENIVLAPGQAIWFLVRAEGGSYDVGDPAQSGSRDEEVEICP